MTPGYSPPEQYGTARTDQRSDIFSLGATLYSALTGATPEDALARAMDQAVLTSIRKHNPRVSRRLASVLEKALETRPENRFQNPDEFKLALLSASSASRRREGDYVIPPAPEESRPIPTENPLVSPDVNNRGPKDSSSQFFPISTHLDEENLEAPRSRTRKRRSGRSCSLILGIVLLMAFAVWAYVTFLDPDLPIRVSANLPFMIVPVTPVSTVSGSIALTATMPPDTSTPAATFTATLLPTLLPTPTATLVPTDTPTPLPTAIGGGGGQVAFASDSTGLPQIYVINTDGTARQQVTDLAEGACQPSWSPDGKRLVFISPCTDNTDYYPGSAMYIINIDGTGLLPLPTVTGGDYDPAWSPDGNWIAFTSLRNSGRPQIYRQSLVDNSVLSLSDKYATDFQPAWSTDGKKLVFISTRRGSPQVWMMDVDGKNQFQFSQSPNYIYSRPSWSPDRTHVVFTQLLVSGGIPRVSVAPVESESYTEFRVGPDSMPMRDAVYSPDGFWLVFEAWQAGKSHDLYLITSNGAGLTQLTEDPRTDFDVAWNPASPSPEQP